MMRTLEQWNNAGFLINKGEKAKMRDERGTPLFDEEQVSKKPRRLRGSRYPRGFFADEDEGNQVMMEQNWPSDSFPDDDIPF